MTYVCPNCKHGEYLWVEAEWHGWAAVGADLDPTRSLDRRPDGRDSDVDDGSAGSGYGCGECNWEGTRDGLLRLGNDGEPLPVLSPEQEALEISEAA